MSFILCNNKIEVIEEKSEKTVKFLFKMLEKSRIARAQAR